MSNGETPATEQASESMSVEAARDILATDEPEAVSKAQAKTAFHTLVQHGKRSEKVLELSTLPSLNLDHEHLTSENMHPVIIKGATAGSVTAHNATIDVPVVFRNCEVDQVDFSNAQFTHDVEFTDSTFGTFRAEETRFEQDADFTGSVFRDRAEMDEALFADDARFRDVTFDSACLFRLATFDGSSNELDDNVDFSETVFHGPARFDKTEFGCATFANCTAAEEFSFKSAVVSGEMLFEETTFDGDVSFEHTRFAGQTNFDGATFGGMVTFTRATVSELCFNSVLVRERATFDAVHFVEVASFRDASCNGPVTFDDARFDSTADFTNTVFRSDVSFTEVRFQVSETQSITDTVFVGTTFLETADFSRSIIGSIEFTDNDLPAEMSFRNTLITGRFNSDLRTTSPVYIDFSDAKIKRGKITYQSGEPLWLDFTEASLGDVRIRPTEQANRHELLDQTRFCDTEFNEFDGERFDFSAYTSYFDRNDWLLHSFQPPPHIESFAAQLTTKNIERTYLKAKNAASATGFNEAAGEFRVKRQRWARKNHFEIAASGNEDSSSRLKSLSRTIENLFLDITCGYGIRLGRILLVFLIAPLAPALLFTFGGKPFETGAGQVGAVSELATVGGQAALLDNIYFSYVTFLTIGYGAIRPIGRLARLVAGVEVYINVILGGLVIYSLIKRSEL